MTTLDPNAAPAASAVRAILAGQLRHVLTIAGTAAIAHGIATQGEVSAAIPAAVDYLCGAALVAAPMAWSAFRQWTAHTRWAAAWATLNPPILELTAAIALPPLSLPHVAVSDPPAKENDMSLGSEIKHALGIVIGILIPGADKSTTNLTATVQQEIANAMGGFATAMAAKLKLDTTGMSGPEKIFAITDAMIEQAKTQGFKGDLKIFADSALDVAQAAYRAAEPNFGNDIIALAQAISINPLVTVAAELAAEVVQALADKTVLQPAAVAQAA